jgi:trehalose-6-phosphate synthase
MAAADIGFVTSLYDGMNLVAKEFVAGRVAEDGVLLLSQSAGSADEMTEACLVNPMDPDGMADALEQALSMPVAERQRRMHRLRANLLTYGPQEWLGAISRTADRGGRGLRRGEVDEAREALGPRNDGVPTSSPQAVHS